MSVYMARKDPPSITDRTLSHPGLVQPAAWTMLVALQIAADPYVPTLLFSIALGEVRPWAATMMGVFMLLGGAAVVVGILNSWDNRTRAWALEKAGWILVSTGWLVYAILVMRVFPGSTISWGSALLTPLIGVVRVRALTHIERQAQRAREVMAAETQSVPVVDQGDQG